MKIKHLKKLRDNRYELTFVNEQKMILFDDIIIKYNLLVQKEFDPDFINEVIKENEAMSSYYIALKYINTKLRSEQEIQGYLERKEFSKEVIMATITKLRAKGYLNDKVYLKSFINDQVRLTSNGYYKVLRLLKEKGFEESEIKTYLDDITMETWQEKLEKIMVKKLKTNKKHSGNKLKLKLVNDLFNLGYQENLIYQVLEHHEFKET